jgi:hydroxymethylbilane synthase
MNNIRIGTRASALALAQAGMVKNAVEKNFPGVRVEIIKMTTKGDRITDIPLHKIGSRGLFIKEIEESLLREEIDIAVHSLKDLPASQNESLCIGAFLTRENPGDVLISERYGSLSEIPAGAHIGTGSRRRESQLKNFRPDILVEPLRGNVETRIKKSSGGNLDAIIIAAAGVIRLGLAGKIREYLPRDLFIPSPGQGIIAAQIRKNDTASAEILEKINDENAGMCYAVEREFFLETGGGCFLPIGALCEKNSSGYTIHGYIGDEKGENVFRESASFSIYDPLQGKKLAQKLLDAGGKRVLFDIREKENSDNKREGRY